ncbi:MAG: YeeE/YedE family protein [Oligoflexia bacterium]|nr:YeeE/YedE family protein [Oligoflexia bacterium]
MENIIYPLLGGALIGLSSSTMLGGIGRITGISGILGGSLQKNSSEDLWRLFFLLGLVLGGLGMKVLYPQFFTYQFNFSYVTYIVAGLIVGFGTRLGSGCTSGHGVCGMARLAKRSIVATLTFMAFGIITVAIKGLI